MDPDDLVDNLGESPTEDRIVFSRTRPDGKVKIDLEILERTSFQNSMPEVVRETRLGPPLSCGHHSTKDNPAAYCGLCGNEHCQVHCSRACFRCGRVISPTCCAKEYENTFVCFKCRRTLRWHKAMRACFSFLGRPFLDNE